MVFGIASFGGDFVKINIFGISFTYITMAILFFSYLKYLIIKKGTISIDKRLKALIIFELYGILIFIFSLMGINRHYISSELYTNIAYIPRQSYYLLFLPTIVLMREEMYIKYLRYIINKYGNYLFWLIYIIQVIVNKAFCISVPTVLILAGLALYTGKTKRTLNNILKLVVIALTPIAIGGELTNIIIRLIYLSIYLFRNQKRQILKTISFGLTCMIIVIFTMPFFYPFFENKFDANSFWRLRYWHNEIEQLLKSNFIGVGYGTSYATESFVGELGTVIGGPFGATAEYTMLEKLFIVGPHNSYIAIFFRLGIVGIVTFLYMTFSINTALKKYFKDIMPVSIFLFFSSSVLIGVNVGLESPYYLILYVFSLGIVNYDITRCEKIN